MKVKIGNTIYDGKDQPVMVILNDYDKENINKMLPHCTKYACFPIGVTVENMEKFMKTEE